MPTDPFVVTNDDPTRARFRTADGRNVGIFDETGRFDALLSPAIVERIQEALGFRQAGTPDFSRFYLWGDSRTEGAGDGYPKVFPIYMQTDLPGIFVRGFGAQNLGRSGQTSPQIVARQGGRPALLTLSGGQIPASGSVAVTAASANIFAYAGSAYSPFSFFNSQIGTLAGVPGTYATDMSGNQTFTRTASGSAVAVPSGTAFVPDLGIEARSAIGFLCAGTNDSKADLYEIVRNTLAARQYAEAGGGLLMVAGIIGERRGSPSDTSQAAIVALNQMLKAAHGRYFVDFLTPPTTAEMTAVGYAPTSADLADIAAGYWPGGLYATGDDTHFIGAGQNIYANRAAALFTTLKASH